MLKLLNTLYITTPGTYIRRDHDNIIVHPQDSDPIRIPVHHISDIFLLGRTSISSGLIELCSQHRIPITFLSESGSFLAQLRLPTTGNILLRLQQYHTASSPALSSHIAKNIVAAKIQNARNLLLRSARDYPHSPHSQTLRQTAQQLDRLLPDLRSTDDLNQIRGYEGQAALLYFNTFHLMIRADTQFFSFDKRTRRPPRNPTNAILSLLYSLLLKDCTHALDSIGLDPQLGFLHTPRPGRPSLALDIMEELRPVLPDRITLSLVNRRQLSPSHFTSTAGVVTLSHNARKTIISAYQERKRTQITHPILKQKIPLGLVPLIQAKLLARALRHDIPQYPPFTYR